MVLVHFGLYDVKTVGSVTVRALQIVAALAVLVLILSVPGADAMPWDIPFSEDWWFSAETHTVNDYLGYVLNSTQSDTWKYVLAQASGEYGDTNVSIRVYVVRSSNATVELTNGYNDVRVDRTGNGAGLQNTTWQPDVTTLYLGVDAVMFKVYLKAATQPWQHKVTLISNRLKTDELLNSTWTFRLYTERAYIAPGITQCYFYWGDDSYASEVENVELAKLAPWEEMNYHLTGGDFVSFLTTPFAYPLAQWSNLIWGFALLFCGLTLYLRYEKIEPIIVVFWIFGGTGGILTMLIPAVGLYPAWFLLAFAFALTLLKLFSR